MNRWLLVGLVGALSAPANADWQETLTPLMPGDFPALRPLKATYRFGWGTVDAATGEFAYSVEKSGQLKLQVTAKTEGLVRSLWRMDARQTAYCDATTLRPVKAVQAETYKRSALQTTLEFTDEGVSRLRVSNPPDKNPPKSKRFKFPATFDLYSALLFVRSQPLEIGEVVRIVVYPAVDPYLAEIEVLKRESLTIREKKQAAIKLGVKLQRIGKKLELLPHAKFKQANAWLSDDTDRLLLKVAAEIGVGKVWAEIDSVTFTQQ